MTVDNELLADHPQLGVDPAVAQETAGAERRRSRVDLAILALFALLVAVGLWISFGDTGFRDSLRSQFGQSLPKLKEALASEFFLNPWFYGVFVVVLVLERLIPANTQPAASAGVRQDLWWVPFKLVVHATVMPLYVVLLGFVYNRYLTFLTIDAVSDWPWLAKVALGLLAGDFLFWVSHYVRHKVRTLWYFHAVHHSQRELNFFTEYRVHPVDDIFSWSVGFIPLFMVSQSFATIVAVVWIRHWHTRLYHSNIRTNLGPLRYVLVTPQSHRVHHSVESRHHDTNFGLTFSIWDHIFGTQYRGYDEYPATGIPDTDFPSEQKGMRLAGLSNLLEQLLYPFQAAARGRG